MKKLFTLISIAAIVVMAVSCDTKQKRAERTMEFVENVVSGLATLSGEDQDVITISEAKKLPPVKKPAFNERELRKELEYALMISAEDEESYCLQVGHFETNPRELQTYVLLYDNGLITLSTKSIKKDGGNNYSIWADVELTPLGKKYISVDNQYDAIKGLDKAKYMSILRPVRDRNAYGELLEEPVTRPEIIKFFTSFYEEIVSNGVNKAVKAYGEEEFIETYARVAKLDSYLKELEIPTLIPNKAFTGGRDIDSTMVSNLVVKRVTNYQNCYKVYFSNGRNAMFILTPGKIKMFDLVLDVEKEATLRTTNKEWTDAQIALYAERAQDPAASIINEKDLNIKKVWYAPGLIPAPENDASRFVYPKEKAFAIDECVYVKLYNKVVDRIYNVSILTDEADDDLGNDYEYTATANVVFKKVNITPFQFVLQKAGEVSAINRANLYEPMVLEFAHYDDRAWGLPND